MSRAHSVLLFLVLCAVASCGSSDDPSAPAAQKKTPVETPVSVASAKGRDVVIVVVDGLRGDLLPKSASYAPFMNELAGQGLNFREATSNSSHVLQSLSSFFTGRLPTRGGAIGIYEAEPHEQSTTIAQAFQGAGYYTGMLANHPAIQGLGYTKGFQEVQVAQAGQPLDDAALVKRAAEFLEDAGTDRIFLYVHLSGVLTSKLVQPDPAADPAAAPFNVRDFGKDYIYSSADLHQSARAGATWEEYYASMQRSDAAVKALVDALQAAGRLENTVLMLTSLHGFELLEHEYLGSGWTLYEESIRVPLVMRAPGVLPSAATDGTVSLVDAMPSLLTLAGIAFDAALLDGHSMFDADGDKFLYTVPDRPRLAELVIPERCILRTVSTYEWKYLAGSKWAMPKERHGIVESHRNTANAIADGTTKAPPMWGAEGLEAIFRMPGEVDASLAENLEIQAELSAVLRDYQELCESSGLAPRGPTVTVKAIDADQVENLESLGYL